MPNILSRNPATARRFTGILSLTKESIKISGKSDDFPVK
jgi:hypothetical protein